MSAFHWPWRGRGADPAVCPRCGGSTTLLVVPLGRICRTCFHDCLRAAWRDAALVGDATDEQNARLRCWRRACAHYAVLSGRTPRPAPLSAWRGGGTNGR